MTTLTTAPTMTELLIEDAKPYGAKAVAVKPAEWGGYYVTILGGRVSEIFETEAAAQACANEFVQQIVPAAAPTTTKEIVFDRETRDYAMYLNGEFVGYAPCYHVAEVELDRLAYERLDRAGVEPELTLSATALDGGSSVEEIAAEYAESLPIANFRSTIAGPLWDQGYTSPNLPDNARGFFYFTVDACPVCQRLLNHSIYANAAGAWLAYDWCLECDRGQIAGQSCSGMQFSCNRPATQHIYSNATGMMHLCDAHAAEWQSYGPDDDHPTADPARLAAQDLIASSFLARVPDIAADLVRNGAEPHAAITRAIETARTHEERLCLMMIAPELSYAESEAAERVQQTMCERLYRQFRAEMAATNPDPAECPSTTEPRPVEDLPAATYPAWLLGLPDVAPAALPDPCFILPDGAATQSIILCIGGVSRVVSAQGVAEALALASVHMRK